MEPWQALENLCLLDIPFAHTYIAAPGDYPMHNRGRYHCGMMLTLKGTEVYRFRDRELRAEPDTVLFIPKGEEYRIRMEEEQSIAVTVDFEMAGNGSFRPFLLRPEEAEEIRGLFSRLLTLWNHREPGRGPELKSVFYQILARLLRQEQEKDGAGEQRLEAAMAHLHRHYLEPGFRVEEPARRAGISPRYFQQLFYRKYGMTPREYVILQKIHLAKELLQSERHSVTHTAAALGYGDVYHFSKIFKAKTGMTPTEYKKNRRDG